MNKFIQHIPTFVEGCTPKDYLFETTEQLLQTPLFLEASQRKNFNHFAISDNYIMQVCDNGKFWWVMGTVLDSSSIDLPKWKANEVTNND